MNCLKLSGNKALFAFLAAALVCAASGCRVRPLYRNTQVLMGTFIEVISPDARAHTIVFSEIKRIEKLLSKYDPESEISRLNADGALKVSPETYLILQRSRELWMLSNGAFDVTVGPLLDIWGFTAREPSVPEPSEIAKTLSRIGMDKIIFNPRDNMVKFSVPGVKIDLGGIGKGFALDCAIKKLKAEGITSCLINAGGQIACLGKRYGKPWRIAVKDPRPAENNPAAAVLELSDGSLSTSGDYEQYFKRRGRRYSHIIDPKTGTPSQSRVTAVTIKANDGATADALSTAVFVLGEEKGRELIKRVPGAEIKKIYIEATEN